MNTSIAHKILALAFSAVFLLNVFLPSIIFTHFKINQGIIAATLCVDKDAEESTCNGKCQLKKSLAVVEATKPQKENFELTIESNITGLFFTSIEEIQFIDRKELNQFFGLLNQNNRDGFYNPLLRPPILSSYLNLAIENPLL